MCTAPSGWPTWSALRSWATTLLLSAWKIQLMILIREEHLDQQEVVCGHKEDPPAPAADVADCAAHPVRTGSEEASPTTCLVRGQAVFVDGGRLRLSQSSGTDAPGTSHIQEPMSLDRSQERVTASQQSSWGEHRPVGGHGAKAVWCSGRCGRPRDRRGLVGRDDGGAAGGVVSAGHHAETQWRRARPPKADHTPATV